MCAITIGTVLTVIIFYIIIKDWNTEIKLKDWNAEIKLKDWNAEIKFKDSKFAICSSFWEQQTNALYNMWSYQKWANVTGFRTLEPFVQSSNFQFTTGILNKYKFKESLSFGDYFDLNFWNKMTMKNYGFPPL